MNKIVKSLIFLSATILLINCNKDYEAPNSFSDIMYTTSSGTTNANINNPIYNASLGHYLTFLDLSQGVISTEWSIVGQDGLKFLQDGFGTTTSSADSLNRLRYVIKDSILNTKKANLYFQKEGKYTLTWKNVFKDSVGYLTFGSVKDPVTGMWVFTRVFDIQILGALIPDVTILKNTTEVISPTIDTIFLVKGDNLTFTDISKGNPTTFNWKIAGGLPTTSTAVTFTSKFNVVGTYSPSSLNVTRASSNATLNASLNVILPIIKVQ